MMLRDIADRATRPLENRDFPTAWEIRADNNADGPVTFEGIASMVDTPYTVRDMFGEFTETITRGAFNRTLKQKADVRLLVNHEGVPLARTKSGTLRLSADPNLRAVSELDPKNPDVQRVQSAVGRGDLDQMSIGMRVKDQEWNEDYTERTIREIELFDVSVVTFPASPTTSASLRSIDELLTELADLELDEADLRRAIVELEKRLPAPVEVPAARGVSRDLLMQLWDRRLDAAA
jgi:HK97 family phage prohead protease